MPDAPAELGRIVAQEQNFSEGAAAAEHHLLGRAEARDALGGRELGPQQVGHVNKHAAEHEPEKFEEIVRAILAQLGHIVRGARVDERADVLVENALLGLGALQKGHLLGVPNQPRVRVHEIALELRLAFDLGAERRHKGAQSRIDDHRHEKEEQRAIPANVL
jgi:hypothetical protein